MKKFLGLAAIIAALGFLFAAAGCSNASDSNNAALLGLLNGAPKQTPAPTELDIPLTLEAVNAGTITLTNPPSTFKYKLNDGEFQTVTIQTVTTTQTAQNASITINVGTITVAAGDKIAMYADGTANTSSQSFIPLFALTHAMFMEI